MKKFKLKIWGNGIENKKFKLKEDARSFELLFKGQYGYSNIRGWVSKFLKDVGDAKSSKELKKLETELENKRIKEKLKEQKITTKFNSIKKNVAYVRDLSKSSETLITSLTSDTNSTFSFDSISTNSSASSKTRKFSRESSDKGTERDMT